VQLLDGGREDSSYTASEAPDNLRIR